MIKVTAIPQSMEVMVHYDDYVIIPVAVDQPSMIDPKADPDWDEVYLHTKRVYLTHVCTYDIEVFERLFLDEWKGGKNMIANLVKSQNPGISYDDAHRAAGCILLEIQERYEDD